jgi:hypothetical protein
MTNYLVKQFLIGVTLVFVGAPLFAQDTASIQSQVNELCSKNPTFAEAIAVMTDDNGKPKATLVIPGSWDEAKQDQFKEAISTLSPECKIGKAFTFDSEGLRSRLNCDLAEENKDRGEFVRRVVLNAADGIVSVRPEGRLSSKIGHLPFSNQLEIVERVTTNYIEKQRSLNPEGTFEFLVPDTDGMLTPVGVREQLSLGDQSCGPKLLKTIDTLRLRSSSDYAGDPCLENALIEIVPTLDHAGAPGEVQIYLWHADGLTEACDWQAKLKKSLGIENLRVVETNELPLNTLKEKLNFVFESTPAFDGCHIEDLSLAPVIEDDEILSINVLIKGFAAEQAQIAKINQAVEKLFMSAVKKESPKDYLSFSDPACTSNIAFKRPNAGAALEWYTKAVSQFKDRQFDRALNSIQTACELNPSQIAYRWWRCLILQQLGKTDQAEQAMLEACLRFKKNDSSFGNLELFNSLQSVQGEMRKSLIDLEEKAKREMTNY